MYDQGYDAKQLERLVGETTEYTARKFGDITPLLTNYPELKNQLKEGLLEGQKQRGHPTTQGQQGQSRRCQQDARHCQFTQQERQ